MWNRLDLKTGDITEWYAGDDISELVFVGPESTSILYLNSTNEEEDGGVSLYFADAESLDNATMVASLPAPYAGLKAAETSEGDIRFVLSAKAYKNGTAYNEQLAAPSGSTGMVYDSIFIRHWVSEDGTIRGSADRARTTTSLPRSLPSLAASSRARTGRSRSRAT